MENLIEQSLTEMKFESYFSYILNDNNSFSSTEYKVLLNQAEGCFVKCMKSTHNGKVQLCYLTKDLKPLAAMLPNLGPENFLSIIADLLSDIINITNNGFLSCRNIDISFKHVFVNTSTYKVSLIYLPLSDRIFEDNASFESALRTKLIRVISEHGNLVSALTRSFSLDLANGNLSLGDLYRNIKGGKLNSNGGGGVIQSSARKMQLIAMNLSAPFAFDINKTEFIIGKKQELVDGYVSFNNMVSRRHCKINNYNGSFTITDLGSANGTFVNMKRILPNQPHPLNNGDTVRMANSDFRVSIR